MIDGGIGGERNVISFRMDGGSGGERYVSIVSGWTGVVGKREMLLQFQGGRGKSGREKCY